MGEGCRKGSARQGTTQGGKLAPAQSVPLSRQKRRPVTPSPPRTECSKAAPRLGRVGEREGVRGRAVMRGQRPEAPAPSPLPSPPLHGRGQKAFGTATAGERAWRVRRPLEEQDPLCPFRSVAPTHGGS